jgi:uncharacterized RDD family membrane protein YckC
LTAPSGLCAECGARHAPGANYCRECGAPVPEESKVPAESKAPYEAASYSVPPARAAQPERFEPPEPTRRPDQPHQYDYRQSTISSRSSAVPGELAGMGTRTGSWLINNVAVQIIGGIPVLGWAISLGAFIWTLMLYRRGQDVGARLLGLRVVRDTGEVAGFYHMWTRGLASIISFLAIGAGFWTAYSDADNQTWHDKCMGTYVVKAGPEVDDLPGTSSPTAVAWFWGSLVFGIALIVMALALGVSILDGSF